MVLFEVFSSNATKFYKRFFLLRPRTEVALINVLKVVERRHEEVGFVSTLPLLLES